MVHELVVGEGERPRKAGLAVAHLSNAVGKIVSWTPPAPIVYGTPLSTTQLNAAAYQLNGTTPLNGTLVYSPAAGTVLTIGSKQLSVTFTPNDTANYTSTTKVVPLTVSPETLTIFANSYTRLYGVANPVFKGNITGAQNGDIFSETFSSFESG